MIITDTGKGGYMLVSKGAFSRSVRGVNLLIKAIRGDFIPQKEVLHLTLHKKWFDQILSGKKKIEYREATSYWKSRLEGKSYKYIHFVNGYGAHRPWMDVKFLGAVKNNVIYEIKLGKVLRKGNINGD